MQVPERLALIGGSILLASTLIFTLKSQVTSVIPQVHSATSALVQGDNSWKSDGQQPNLVDTNDDDVRSAKGWTNDENTALPFQAEKGKKYHISMMINNNNHGYIELWNNNSGIYSGGVSGLISDIATVPDNPSGNYQLVQGDWTADHSGTVYVRHATSDSGWNYWKDVTVTQSSAYVPFETAQQNKDHS